MPAADVNNPKIADDSIVRRIRPLAGATAPYLFRLIECS